MLETMDRLAAFETGQKASLVTEMLENSDSCWPTTACYTGGHRPEAVGHLLDLLVPYVQVRIG
jgi:hypothetical protein